MSTDIQIPSEATLGSRGVAVSQATTVEQSRAEAEVKAAVFVAQQFPRDIGRARAEMREACGKMRLAEEAFYRVPNRGEGPSVHLARELATIWGNLSYGVKELARDDEGGQSEVLAYCWDQQRNTRGERSFIVPHAIMKGSKRQKIVDLSDIYRNNQNVGARAVRECILTVLPTEFVEEAKDICRRTLEHGEGEPLEERVTKMLAMFADMGVKPGQIETRLGRKRSAWSAGDVASLGVTFKSIQRGETTVDEEFQSAAVTAAEVVGKPTLDLDESQPQQEGS